MQPTQAPSRRSVTSSTPLSMATITAENFDVNAVTFNFHQAPMPNGMMRKQVYINASAGSRDKVRLQLSMDMLKTLWGASVPKDSSCEDGKRKYDCSVSDFSEELISKISAFDERCVAYCHAESHRIWGKPYDITAIRELMFRSPMSITETKGHHNLLRLKIRENACNIWLMHKKCEETKTLAAHIGAAEDITPESKLLVVVEMSSMWFINASCGYSLNVVDVLVDPVDSNRLDANTIDGGFQICVDNSSDQAEKRPSSCIAEEQHDQKRARLLTDLQSTVDVKLESVGPVEAKLESLGTFDIKLESLGTLDVKPEPKETFLLH